MTDADATDRWCVCNGASIRYHDEGSGLPVILVHGWTLDLEMWNSQMASLRSSFRVICFDRRGFGLSSGHPSIDRDCEDLDALCRHLAVGRVALVGMSQGARPVMRFAAAAPDKVTCVVLDGPPDLLGTDAADFEALEQYSALARTQGIDAFRREWVNHPLVRLRTRDPSAQQTLRSMIERYPGKDLAAAAVSSEFDVQTLQSFEAPTLIITGDHDIADRIESANVLARHLPRAERATIPGAGHLPNLDNPPAYNALLRAFLGRHTTAPS
jgi:pimeloyl-ACP methyl ester carboxylesterase